jgi:hypothetical protein
MLNIKTINTAPLFPLKLNNSLNLYGNFVQTMDGYSFYSYEALTNVNDVSLQKDSGLILTKQNSLQALYKTDKQSINSLRLNGFGYLRFIKTNHFVVFDEAPTVKVSNIYTTEDFLYFKFNSNKTLSLLYKNLYLTVSREYPYNIYLDQKRPVDRFNEQQFKFTQEQGRLNLITFVTEKKQIQVFKDI